MKFRQPVIMMGAGRRKGALERGGGIGTDRMGLDDWERGNRLHFRTSIIVLIRTTKSKSIESCPVFRKLIVRERQSLTRIVSRLLFSSN